MKAATTVEKAVESGRVIGRNFAPKVGMETEDAEQLAAEWAWTWWEKHREHVGLWTYMKRRLADEMPSLRRQQDSRTLLLSLCELQDLADRDRARSMWMDPWRNEPAGARVEEQPAPQRLSRAEKKILRKRLAR